MSGVSPTSIVSSGPPIGEGAGVAIMIHGRNAGPKNILDLVPALDRPGWTYLAPAAAGSTWYPYSFMAPTEQNEPALTNSLATLRAVVDDITARGIPIDRLVLLGFSQGACLACEFAYRNAQRLGGIVAFSGGLIGPPGTIWSSAASLDGTPVFLGCSDVDAHVPKTRVDETSDVLRRIGADVRQKIYPGMGHLVNDDEIAHAQAILDSAAGRS